MLTSAAAQRARVQPRAYKRSNGGGLLLHVSIGGRKSWRWRFATRRRDDTGALSPDARIT